MIDWASWRAVGKGPGIHDPPDQVRVVLEVDTEQLRARVYRDKEFVVVPGVTSEQNLAKATTHGGVLTPMATGPSQVLEPSAFEEADR